MIDLIRLIEQKRRSGIYWFMSEDDFDSIREYTDAMNVPFFRIDGTFIANNKEFHQVVKHDLELFDDYGMNYDAFYDCLRDWKLRDWKHHEWMDFFTTVILFDNFHNFAESDHRWFLTSYNCFQDASEIKNVNRRQYFLFRDGLEYITDYMEFENIVFY